MNAAPATDEELAADIEESTSDAPVSTPLMTDDRVLARVTDGIYRQPGSAIRELVSNAYDADASRVVIKTDRPRFETVTIEDDGRGMTAAALAHLLHHIGGSAKRSRRGGELEITDPDDPMRSPGGRRLIGKIGIGLFSVSQLTHRFHIVTKTTGDRFRTVAAVVLRQYSEDGEPESDDAGEYEAGLVKIWREPASDPQAHGTTITLTDIRPQARETLQSRDVWTAIDDDRAPAPDGSTNLEPPAFHIGRVKTSDPDSFEGSALIGGAFDHLPWTHEDSPRIAFGRLVDAVWQQLEQGTPNPKLDSIFDYYLRMVWQLSLAIPAPYVQDSPFDIALGDGAYLYEIPKAPHAVPIEIHLDEGQTVLTTRSIGAEASVGDDFTVLFDDLQLARPLKFTGLPTTDHAVRKPIMFVGQCDEQFEGAEPEFSGGPLRFEAYLMWSPKIAPTEHQGVLARVHGSSGTLFDPTFMRYQVSEQTRLRQTTCEIFVSKGLEAALNIDRESFNYAHPHVAYITKWLHAALRRFATVQKKISGEIRAQKAAAAEAAKEESLSDVAAEAWRAESDDPGAEPPPVVFSDEPSEDLFARPGAYRFKREPILGPQTGQRASQDTTTERQMEAIVQLMAAFGVLDNLSAQHQQRLLSGIRKIIEASTQ